MPDFLTYFSTNRWTLRTLKRKLSRSGSCVGSSDFGPLKRIKRGLKPSNSDFWSNFFKYRERTIAASSSRKTRRDLRPFPITVNSRVRKFIWSRFKLTSSETRKPVLNKTSRIARSLIPVNVSVLQAEKSFRRCFSSKNFSEWASALPSSIRELAITSRSCCSKYFTKERKAITK